ncbi:hypothetical protein C8F04DRAFT_953769 [Mycena alexandri]|uniref:Uncharacterized protein n=1 Tax=Mycena alexandri TaxID=1745969 RepID=A0AAD6SZT7_9AGAR|nr:hypothetical protein C8F04DRAFT_953769 [Mycena alexandri]
MRPDIGPPDGRYFQRAGTLPLPNTSSSSNRKSSITLQIVLFTVVFFLFDFTPRQVYLHVLLRIPSLYFSRVTRIFEDARLSLPDIKRMARANADQWNTTNPQPFPSIFTTSPDQMPLPQSLLHFRASWEGFIDSLMREWKTLNIVSVLLMSAILTMLQIDAASHPITRTSALFSLICALMSLLYGCMYIVRFGGMRKMHKASSFADEAQKGTTSIWWNVWVLLAMPAVWLAWSIIMFLTCIMSFIWLSGSSQDSIDFTVSPRVLLGLRIALTVVFSLGIIYFGLIVRTFHRYGDPLDREWMRRVNEWTKEAASYWNQPDTKPAYSSWVNLPSPTSRNISSARVPLPPPFAEETFSRLLPSRPLTTHPSGFFKAGDRLFSPLEPVTIMQLGNPDVHAPQVAVNDLKRFMLVGFPDILVADCPS